MGKQNEQLLKNIELYEQKKKAEQQKSKILGQKPVNRKANNKEKVNDDPTEVAEEGQRYLMHKINPSNISDLNSSLQRKKPEVPDYLSLVFKTYSPQNIETKKMIVELREVEIEATL